MMLKIVEKSRVRMSLSGANWQVGEGRQPTEWIPARVPGNIQQDLWRAGLKPDPYFGTNAEAYRDTEGKWWTCRRTFDAPPAPASADWRLIFGGVDYQADFYLNGHHLGRHEGMFGEIVFPIGELLRPVGNELSVVIHPLELAPHASRAWVDPLCPERHDGRWMVKSLMSFYWDFAPRLVPTGIWQDVTLEATRGVCLSAPRTDARLENDHKQAALIFTAQVQATRAQQALARLELFPDGPDGTAQPVLTIEEPVTLVAGEQSVRLSGVLSQPRLWWPNGLGEPYLYRARLTLSHGKKLCDGIEFAVGIRTFAMIRTPAHQDELIAIPASCQKFETVMVVNGVPVYYRGINYVPMDILFGRIDKARIETQMRLVRDGNCNLLRVWGGGIVNRDLFFDLADRYGIMLWQEFPLGCTDHAGNEHYQQILGQEAAATVRRLRHHPSVVLWCGGNELFLNHSGMQPLDALLRMLNAVCYNLDPDRIFLPTSPLPGAFHGPYTFDGDGQGLYGKRFDLVQFCNTVPDGAYNECGIAGPAHADLIRHCLPREEWWPPTRDGNWKFHKGFGAWGSGESWLPYSLTEEYFGPLSSLEDLGWSGQFLQAIGLQYLCEEIRRRWPNCSGTMPWCFNYPWTTVAGSCVVDYPDVPRPAYYTLQRAYAPRSVSARLQHFVLLPGETIAIEIVVCNDTAVAVPPARVEVEIGPLGQKPWRVETLETAAVERMGRLRLPVIPVPIPADFAGVVHLRLRWRIAGDDIVNEYWMGTGALGTPERRDPAQCFRPLLTSWREDAASRLPGMRAEIPNHEMRIDNHAITQ